MAPSVLQIAAQAREAAEAHPVTFVDFLTVTLTALCAMLAILTIGIGIAAIYGYSQIREEITSSLRKQADGALAAKLNEYPDSAEIIACFAKWKSYTTGWNGFIRARKKRAG